MTEATITMALDIEGDARTFAPGETVRGNLLVDANTDVDVHSLSVGLRWGTRGKGNQQLRTAAEKAWGRVTLGRGRARVFPFELTVPESAPPTYAGALMDVAWMLEARADREWAWDEMVGVELTVLPGASRSLQVKRLRANSTSEVAIGVALAFGIANVAAIIACGFASVLVVASVYAALAFAAVLLFGAMLLFPRRRRALFHHYYTTDTATVTVVRESDGYRGAGVRDRLECVVESKGLAPLNGGTATLRVYESICLGTGDNARYERHELHRHSAPLSANGTRWVARLDPPAPDVARFSIDIEDNELVWEVTFDLDIRRWPNAKLTVQLDTRPTDDGTTAAYASVNSPS
ncbi:MAG: sporulation protein [Sandaracinaceae bacterium]|nr:sporulation protein [Myxococcales bacterium]MCB9660414.1 sporulation protein [Sandaracinaceae bacterium]